MSQAPTTPRPSVALIGRTQVRLLRWFDAARRPLPWRESSDPYRVWVSEVMLQQTQVATVVPYFQRFLLRFPDLPSLAAASEEEVLRCWAGLGYYSRARNLHRAARVVVAEHGGVFPSDPESVRKLPGIGKYTAGALLSIAFGLPAPVVDGNVTRVLCRLFAIQGDPKRNPLQGELWRLAEALVPRDRPGDYNQAIMELGATVCTPRSPACSSCPLEELCLARQKGIQERLPQMPRAPAPEPVETVAAVLVRERKVLLIRPRDSARWRGLWQFPQAQPLAGESYPETARRCAQEALGVSVAIGPCLGTINHGITRFRITLHAFLGTSEREPPQPRDGTEARWHGLAALADLGMPAPHRRIGRLLAHRDELKDAPPGAGPARQLSLLADG